LDGLKIDLTDAYTKGKISEQHYANLKSEISVVYQEIYKKKIDSLNDKDSNGIILDKVKDTIKDAYAKEKLSEQHYQLLNEKICDSKKLIRNAQTPTSSSESLVGSPFKNNKRYLC
jgi:uncharacterized membrane protein